MNLWSLFPPMISMFREVLAWMDGLINRYRYRYRCIIPIHIISFKSVRHFSEERGDTHLVHGSDEYSNLTWVGWVLLGCHTLRRTGVRLVHVACRLVSGFCMFLLLTWLVRDGGMRRQGCMSWNMHACTVPLFMHNMNSMPLCLLCLLKSVFRRQQGSSRLLITNQSTFSRSCCVKVAVTCWFRHVKEKVAGCSVITTQLQDLMKLAWLVHWWFFSG